MGAVWRLVSNGRRVQTKMPGRKACSQASGQDAGMEQNSSCGNGDACGINGIEVLHLEPAKMSDISDVGVCEGK